MSACWIVPTDFVERLVTPTGLAFVLRARMRGADLKPAAQVFIRNGRYVAEVTFETPIGPERQQGLTLMLGIVPTAVAA